MKNEFLNEINDEKKKNKIKTSENRLKIINIIK